MVSESCAEARLLELLRLDQMLASIYASAVGGNIAALDRCLAISAQRAKILGLDLSVSAAAVEDPLGPAQRQGRSRVRGTSAQAKRRRRQARRRSLNTMAYGGRGAALAALPVPTTPPAA